MKLESIFKNISEQAKKLWESFNNVQKLVLILVAIFAVGGFASMANYSTQTVKVLLYEDLSVEDYAKISQKLDSLGYTWSGKGTSRIEVNPKHRQAIITELAQEDLIPTGVEGYEIFDMSRWDETTFDKNIKLHRAIKGSLEKMLMTLSFIKRARVELAIPRQNNFINNDDPVKASVLVEKVPGIEKISRKQVVGIKNLIYRAIPRLKRENISISDEDGNELVEPDSLDAAERELKIVEKKKDFEEKERKRWRQEIQERLHQFYPEDRISIIRVSLNINWNKVQETQNLVSPVEAIKEDPNTPYSERQLMPNGSLIISQNKRDERFRGNGFTPGGPTGTEEQLPPGYRDLDYQRSEYGNNDTITNYAFNTQEKQIEYQPWEEQARSIAVAVDGTWTKVEIRSQENGKWKHMREYSPPSQEELQTLTQLLKASLLYKESRGDIIEVKHLKKDRNRIFAQEDKNLNKEKEMQRLAYIGSISLAIFVICLLLYRGITKEIARRRKQKEEELNIQRQIMQEAALQTMSETEKSLDEQTKQEVLEGTLQLAQEKPEQVAKLLKNWLKSD